MRCYCDHTRGQSCGWCDGTYTDDPRIDTAEDAQTWAEPNDADTAENRYERHLWGDAA